MMIWQAVPGALSEGVLSSGTTHTASTEGKPMVSRCGHAKTLLKAISIALDVSEEDIENSLLNQAAHEYYLSEGLPLKSEYSRVAKTVGKHVRSLRVLVQTDGE